MTVEQIPSDKLVKMTRVFHKAFKSVGCDPMCHCCNKFLPIGSMFKLATVREAKPAYNNGSLNKDMVDLINSGKDEKIWGLNKEYKLTKDELFKESKEVMLCDVCIVELYEDKQLKKILTYNTQGGCFRINGKIVH